MDDFRYSGSGYNNGLNAYFELGDFKQHPEKNYVECISHGMDWLGTEFNAHGTTGVAPRALSTIGSDAVCGFMSSPVGRDSHMKRPCGGCRRIETDG